MIFARIFSVLIVLGAFLPLFANCVVFADRDGDGFGSEKKVFDYDCPGDVPVGYSRKGGDCNDNNRYVNPKAEELCNGIDDNCDKIIDPENAKDCNRYYKDLDSDGFGTDGYRCLCVSEGDFRALEMGDCNDSNSKIHPETREVCNDLDDNCNGEVDEGENVSGCRPFYLDSDGDGFGSGDDSKCLCKPLGLFRAEKTGDCNDNNPAIYPGAHEYFDRLDNNCNGIIDENPGNMPPPPHRKLP